MKFTASVLALLFAATGSLAAPGGQGPSPPAHHNPPPPPPPQPIVQQANQCGNGAQPYCCNNAGNKNGDVECSPIDVSSSSNFCSGISMCCNNNGGSSGCNFNQEAGSVTITKKTKVDKWGW
ncbi:hypothetical protein FSARC_10742 [Fusarium sarcochroum]|uniref:Hydrophobin n=1 Tax=Fusarium sarcochroum TaxID=1208366 RepID=A0A8H4X2E8_9HYPO|nr:hypothetical protein FSARC_10742 [Fusarium sarcochroum]